MRHVTANTARVNFDGLFDNVTRYNEPVTIVSDNDRAVVVLSMEDWNGIQETLYLQSIPGMVDSIRAAAAEPLKDGIPASEVSFDV
jgi:prevent-host-death family protein